MEEIIKSALLGAIQGITEFLPVSSSGHLVIIQNLTGFSHSGVAFDVLLHAATLLCIFIYFRKDIVSIFAWVTGNSDRNSKAMLIAVCIATVPTGIVGLIIEKYGENLFLSPLFAASMLIITAIILLLSVLEKRIPKSELSTTSRSMFKAALIGTAQGLAVLPGISRSGTTISTGLLLGLDRNTAFRFSFLASIPAVTGALILKAKDIADLSSLSPVSCTVGFITAAVTGYLSLELLNRLSKKGRLYLFAPYCAAVGTGVLIYTLVVR